MKKQINVPSIIFSRFNEDSSWKSKKFKELLDQTEGIRRGPFGSALKKEFFVQNSEYVVYEQQNAIYDHFNTRYRISEEKYHELNKFMLSSGDFIMSGAGTIGKISLVPDGIEKGVFNQALIRLRVNKNINKEFFLQWMRSPEMQNNLTKANPASAMVNLVPMSEVKEWDVIVPSFEEQSAIGSLFRTLDNLLSNYKDNLANYQSLKATMLSKMFPKAGQTVPEIRLDGFEGEWELIKLGEVCDLITKGTTAKSQSEQGKVNFIKVENLKDNEIYSVVKISEEEHLGSLKRSILFEGDILFSIAGTLGRTAIVRNNILPANTNQALAIIRGYKLDTYFLLVVLSGEVVKDYIRKNPTVGAQPNLSLEQVSSLKIQAPSMEEQQAIGSYFSNLDNLIASHQDKISQLETLKKKLLQDMFI